MAGQSVLQKVGIDPILGFENLVWAPMGIDEQHGEPALKEVVDTLRKVEANHGMYKHCVAALKKLGQIAAARE
jgi:hypothetical protein